ncbi:BLUF domain containing protein [Burkholderiaceae bacterium]
MQLHSITYTSVASYALSKADLEHLLSTARKRNLEQHITGVLLYVEGRFMQYLEGPKAGLEVVLPYIKSSPMHHHLDFQNMKAMDAREYEAWSMAYVTPDDPNGAPSLSSDMTQFLNQTSRQVLD